jgi:hypothetical protein
VSKENNVRYVLFLENVIFFTIKPFAQEILFSLIKLQFPGWRPCGGKLNIQIVIPYIEGHKRD